MEGNNSSLESAQMSDFVDGARDEHIGTYPYEFPLSIAPFMSVGVGTTYPDFDPERLAEMQDGLSEILGKDESVLHAVRQEKPFFNWWPTYVMLTDRRLIICRKRRGFRFHEYSWDNVTDVSIYEWLFSSEVTFNIANGVRISVNWLPQYPAMRLYAMATERIPASPNTVVSESALRVLP